MSKFLYRSLVYDQRRLGWWVRDVWSCDQDGPKSVDYFAPVGPDQEVAALAEAVAALGAAGSRPPPWLE